jgi:hypothetical protein
VAVFEVNTGPMPPLLSWVIVPVCRSTHCSVRTVGGTMSPFSFGCSFMRVNTRKRPSADSAGWSSSSGVLTPAGTATCAPVAALTIRISNPLPVTYSS